MNKITKLTIGISAALVASASKFLAHDYSNFNTFLSLGQQDKAYPMLIGISILFLLLSCIAGVVCLWSRETDSFKLLALGISAPGLITTWTVEPVTISKETDDQRTFEKAQLNSPQKILGYKIASSHTVFPVPDTQNAQKVKDPTAESVYLNSVLSVFGIKRVEPNYWVIVGSHKNQSIALEQAAKINEENSAMDAFVGKRRPNNPYYPVIIGEFTTKQQAKAQEAEALKLDAVNDAYLDAYAPRK